MADQSDELTQFRNAAKALYQQGQYADAIKAATAAVQLGIHLHGQGDPSVAEDFGFLGLIYKAAGIYDRAEECYRYAIDTLRSTKGNDAKELANHLNNLGVLYKLLGRFADAAPLYQDALRLRQATFGEHSLEVINSRSNIAALFEAAGNEDAALSEYIQAMELARSVGEDAHPFVTTILNNLGSLYGRRGQWSLAEPLLREAVERSASDNGATHPRTGMMQINLGEALLRQGRPSEAGEIFLQALTSLRATLGDDHERVTFVKQSLTEAIRALTLQLDTECPSPDPVLAKRERDNLATFTSALKTIEPPPETAEEVQSANAPGGEEVTLSFDISQVDESLRPAVMQAFNAFNQTGRIAPFEALVQKHPELRPVIESVVAQIRTASGKVMGSGIPELLAAISAATDADERAALCRKALPLVSRDDRPDIWFFLQWTLAGTLASSTGTDKEKSIEDAIAAMLAALSVDRTCVPPASWASALSSLGQMYGQRVRGDPVENIERAIEAFAEALTIPEHRADIGLHAATQNNLANAYVARRRGERDDNLSRAVFLLEQVLRVTPRDISPDEWARTQNNLGAACMKFQRRDVVSNRERAIEALQQALAVRTRERNAEKWAETMVNIGHAWRRRLAGQRRHNLAEARASYRNALKVWTRESDPDKHIMMLNMLAVTCLEDRDAAEFSLGPSFVEPELLIPITNEELQTIASDYPELAELVDARRDGRDQVTSVTLRELQLARSIMALCLIERAVDRKRFLAHHPELESVQAQSVIELAQANLGTTGIGDFGEAALALLEESHLFARWISLGLDAALRERIEFEELDEHASRLAAKLWALSPEDADAMRLITEAVQADEMAIGRFGAVSSELQRRRFLPNMRARMTAILAAIISRQTVATELAIVGMNVILQRKKVEGELWSRFRGVTNHPADDAASQMYAELLLTRRRIAEKILSGAADEGSSAFQRHLLNLRIKEQRLEMELTEFMPAADLGARLSLIEGRAVADAMPRGSALVEFLRLPLTFTDDDTVPENRYLGAVLLADKPELPLLIDLGSAEAIDSLVAETRSALTGDVDLPSSLQGKVEHPKLARPFLEAGRQLRNKVFDPVCEALAGARIVYLSPDGDLARLPFAILPTSGDQYLIDSYEFRYVGAGRDLLRFRSPRPARCALPLVVADPDFDLKGADASPHRVFFFEDLFGGISSIANPKDRPLEKPDLKFGPLKWGRDEGRTVAQRLGVKPVVGKGALKKAVMECRSPWILHLATHGIFLEDRETPPRSSDDTLAHRVGMRIVPRHEDPLMLSWLLFAGANRWLHREPVPDDAGNCVITAMEAATMSLHNTELVVLSACETGLGVIKVGEGVLGLRRAFAFAGARSVIMTLWEVPDRSTRDIVVKFYALALSGSVDRASALREAQLALKKQRPDPYFWGAIVCEGEPGPLAAMKGQRKTQQRRSEK